MNKETKKIVRTKFGSYIKAWESKDTNFIPDVFSNHIGFFTSTCLHMADGSQNSRFGVRDFLLDFPKTEKTETQICNLTIKGDEEKILSYAQVVCNCQDKEKYFQFVALIQCTWIDEQEDLKIYELKQTIVPIKGDLLPVFRKSWRLDEKLCRNTDPQKNPNFKGWDLPTDDHQADFIFAQEDSPWNLADEEGSDEEEKVLDVLYGYFYGLEHLFFLQSLRFVSLSYGTIAGNKDGEARRNLIMAQKEKRLRQKMSIHPLRIREVSFENERALVLADLPADQNNAYPGVDASAYGRLVCELFKEDGDWKIVYLNEEKGIYFDA